MDQLDKIKEEAREEFMAELETWTPCNGYVDSEGMLLVWEWVEKLLDKASKATRESILQGLRKNWTKLVALQMAASMQGKEDEMWEEVEKMLKSTHT